MTPGPDPIGTIDMRGMNRVDAKPREVPPPLTSKVTPTNTPSVVNPVFVKPKPASLTYKWEGTCDQAHPLDTLTLEGVARRGQIACVAWCPVCKKQVKQRIVVDISMPKEVIKHAVHNQEGQGQTPIQDHQSADRQDSRKLNKQSSGKSQHKSAIRKRKKVKK